MSNFARFMQAAAGGSSSSSGGGGGLNRSPSGTQDTSGHHANTLFHIQTSGETGDVRSVTDQSGSSHTVDYDYGSQIGSFNPFTENYTTNENAKNDDWITVSGDVDYGAPKLDYLRFTHDSSFDFGTGDFTIETWIYPLKNPPGDQFLFMQTGSGNNKFMWYYNSVQIKWLANGSITDAQSWPVQFKYGNWYHLAIARSFGRIRMYVNGTNVGYRDYSTSFDSSFNPTIGAHSYLTTNAMDARLYNYRVSKGIARYPYNGGFTPTTTMYTDDQYTSLLLTSNSTRDAYEDISSHAHTITYGGLTDSKRALIGNHNTIGTARSKNGYNPSTDGGTAFFSRMLEGSSEMTRQEYRVAQSGSSDFDFGSNDWTVEMFFFPIIKDSQYTQILFDFGVTTTTRRKMKVGYNASNKGLIYYLSSDGTNWDICSDSANGIGTVNDHRFLNRWNHLAFCRSGSTISAYVNGVRDLNLTNITASLHSNNDGMFLGNDTENTTGNAYTGCITQVRVVNGSSVYDATQSTITVPTSQLTNVTNTKLLLHFKPKLYDVMQNHVIRPSWIYDTADTLTAETTYTKYATTSHYINSTSTNYINRCPDFIHGTGEFPMVEKDLAGDFTIEYWFYIPTSVSRVHMFDFRPQSVNGAYITLVLNGQIDVHWSSAYRISGTTTIQADTWYHYALTKSGTSLKQFLNGTQEGSTYIMSGINNSRGKTFCVIGGDGATSGGNYSSQQLYYEDFRMIDGHAKYTANFTPPTAALPTYG